MKLFDPTNDNDFEDPASGTLIGGKTVQDNNQIPITIHETFNETNLDNSNNYTVGFSPERGYMGFAILNENKGDDLTILINGLTIPLPAGKSFYDEFDAFTNVTITGNNLDFTAYIKG